MTARTRLLEPAEVEELVGWARTEGWNPGLSDADAFHAADPQGFIGCFVDDRMVAGISAVAYGADFGFIGLYISKPDQRGKGYGRKVWDAGMAHLLGRAIGLDGVPAQQANYETMGFIRAYTTHRWIGRLVNAVTARGKVVDLSPDLLPAVLDYDRKCFVAPRDDFLKVWLNPRRLVRVLLRGDAVCGYGVARSCHDGFKVGPLFADDVADAKAILSALSDASGGADLHLDIPESAHEFSDWLEAGAFARGFETARMYKGRAPETVRDKVFAITTLELG